MTTPADPGAIERILDAASRGVYNSDSIPTLIAAVEWLRETNDTDRDQIKHMMEEIEALRECVEELKGVLSTEEVLTNEYVNRAEAAEARVVELEGALEEIVDESENGGQTDPASNAELFMLNIARAALPATPAEAMERARAVEVVIVKARRLMNASSSGPFRGDARRDLGTALKALAKLNTLKS